MKLIEEPSCELLRQPRPNESEFRYLKKATDQDSKEVRRRINAYFSNIPKEGQNQLKRTINYDFKAGYLELLTHQIFYNLGYKIQEHPIIEGMDVKPDYLAKNENYQFFIECKKFENLSDQGALNLMLKTKF